MKKIAIVGTRVVGRDNNTTVGQKVQEVFKYINKSNTLVVSGGASTGADYWAKRMCSKLRIPYLEIPALYTDVSSDGKHIYDKYSIYRRNDTIAYMCDMLVVFWDGKSKGTADLVSKAELLGKPVWGIPL